MAAVAAYPTPFTGKVWFWLKPVKGVYEQLCRLVPQLRRQAASPVRQQPGTEVPAGLYFACSADGGQLVRRLRNDAK